MKRIAIVSASLWFAGCGLENFFSNATHNDYPKPTSALSGKASWNGAADAQYFAVDNAFNRIDPLRETRCSSATIENPAAWPNSCFLTSYDATTSTYQMNLPSSKYSWVIAQARTGNMLLSNIVPQV